MEQNLKQQKGIRTKMKLLKKSLALLLALCLIAAVCPVMTAFADSAEADETEKTVVRGDFGDGFHYVYNKYHALLVIHGEGPLVVSDPEPWADYSGDVRRIILDEGITAIPAGAFSGCKKLASVSLPTTFETLDADAFADCGLVSYVMTPGSTTAVRRLLKDANIDAMRCAEVTRVSAKSLADEIANLESDGYLIDYYYPVEDKRTLAEKMYERFMEEVENAKKGK